MSNALEKRMNETKQVEIHKIELYIIDFDKLGADGVARTLANQSFPNDCITPNIVSVETKTVQWHDDHPLNSLAICDMAYKELFGGNND